MVSFGFNCMVVGASVGTGVGVEDCLLLFSSFCMEIDNKLGRVVGWIFGTETMVGWMRGW